MIPIYKTIRCHIMQYRIIYSHVVKILVMWLCVSFCLITSYDWILLQTFLQWTVYHKPWTSWHQNCCLAASTSLMMVAASAWG